MFISFHKLVHYQGYAYQTEATEEKLCIDFFNPFPNDKF